MYKTSLPQKEIITENHNQSKNGLVEHRPNGHIAEERVEKPEKPTDQGVDCKIVSPSNTRGCTHKDSPTRLSKYELIKITPIGRPNGVEESPQGSSLNKEL